MKEEGFALLYIHSNACNGSQCKRGLSKSLFFGELDFSKLSEAWLFWWLGDAVGAMVVGLPIVSYSREKVIRELKGWKGFENLFVFILVFLCGISLFGFPPFIFISIPAFLFISFVLVSWLGLRSGVTLSSSATLMISIIGAWELPMGVVHLFRVGYIVVLVYCGVI